MSEKIENSETFINPYSFFETNFCPVKKSLSKIHFLQFNVSNGCNLNCKSCNHFAPLVKKENFFPDKDQLIKDLNQVSNLTKNSPPEIINLMGGEPLLNKDICEYIKICKALFKDSKIFITTNGLLLDKMSDEFWNLIDDRVLIQVSKYFEKEFYNRLNNFITEKEKTTNIMFLEAGSLGTALFTNYALSKNNSEQSIKEKFEGCPIANKTIQLYNSKLYSCSLCAYLYLLEDYFKEGFKIFEDDGIDIYSNSYEEIMTFLQKPKKTCQYCSKDCLNTYFLPGSSKLEKSEWIKD